MQYLCQFPSSLYLSLSCFISKGKILASHKPERKWNDRWYDIWCDVKWIWMKGYIWWWWWIVFVVWLNDERRFVLFPSRDHCQRSSPSRISDTLQTGFKPAQNLSSGLVEWSYALVITTTPRRHFFDKRYKTDSWSTTNIWRKDTKNKKATLILIPLFWTRSLELNRW